MIGNSKSDDELKTAHEEKIIEVECGMPSKLSFKYSHVDDSAQIAVKQKSNKVLANKDKDLKITFTLKDKEGKTFTNTDSLNIETQVSDESILTPEGSYAKIDDIELTPLAKISGKPQHILKSKGKEGSVDIKVKLAGYNQEVLDKAGIKNPPALPKIMDDDEEAFELHGHSLMDELELHLTSADEIAKHTP